MLGVMWIKGVKKPETLGSMDVLWHKKKGAGKIKRSQQLLLPVW
jgi:hypothetical protein